MDYRRLGKLGVKVSPFCLGTGFRGRQEEAVLVRTVERFLDLGGNFIDSANIYGHIYGQGRAEWVLAKALRGKRDRVVLTSKVCSPMGDGPNDRGLSHYHIMREIEASLKRLQTDHLDIYLLHAWDAETSLEETLRAMEDLVRQGKTRYVGCCNFNAVQTVEALWIADRRGYSPITVLQLQYNLLHRREVEPDILGLIRAYGLGLMTYSPLAVGLLTGRFAPGQPLPSDSPWTPERLTKALAGVAGRTLAKLTDIAQAHGKTPAQVAIAWLLDHPEVSSVILGPDLPEHVDEAFGAWGWTLSREERAALDEASLVPDPPRYDA